MTPSLRAEDLTDDAGSPWHGQRILLSGVFRQGKQVAIALSLTECAELFRLFERDAEVRHWAEVIDARHGQRDTAQDH